jgi:hypothetical protein
MVRRRGEESLCWRRESKVLGARQGAGPQTSILRVSQLTLRDAARGRRHTSFLTCRP